MEIRSPRPKRSRMTRTASAHMISTTMAAGVTPSPAPLQRTRLSTLTHALTTAKAYVCMYLCMVCMVCVCVCIRICICICICIGIGIGRAMGICICICVCIRIGIGIGIGIGICICAYVQMTRYLHAPTLPFLWLKITMNFVQSLKEALCDLQGYFDLELSEQCKQYFRVLLMCYLSMLYFRMVADLKAPRNFGEKAWPEEAKGCAGKLRLPLPETFSRHRCFRSTNTYSFCL